MTEVEALQIKLLCRLFWLITQASGVARYATDVRMFVEAEKLISPASRADELENLAKGYEDQKR